LPGRVEFGSPESAGCAENSFKLTATGGR
jgi:hypothetical protein